MPKDHREEARFTIRLELSAEFDEAYEGDDDGYAWLEAWRARVRPRVVAAVFEALRTGGAFDAIPTSRGASPDDELAIDVRLRRPGPRAQEPRAREARS
jgi:hypothetical protein